MVSLVSLGLLALVGIAPVSGVIPEVAATSVAVSHEERTVSGTVLDQAGAPLSGVQVVAVATDRAVMSDAQGRFRLTGLPAGEVTLRFDLIGYQSETVVVAADTETVRVTLRPTVIRLDELVVTGTAGATQRREIGNTVARVQASDVVQQMPVTNVSQLINARAPGVVVNSGPGVAGAGSRIRIRGRSSISLASDPLIYVDGVRVDNSVGVGSSGRNPARGARSDVVSRLDDFDPEMIESIEIIKGPAAATLYGTEAANGVIQIITKKGTGTPRFNVRMRHGATWFSGLEDRWPVMWARDPSTGELITQNFASEQRARGTPLFRTGTLQGYGADLSGSVGHGVRYFVGLDYNRDESAKFGNYSRNFSGRMNMTIPAHETLDLNASAGLVTGHVEAPGGFELPVYPVTRPLWRDEIGGGEVSNIPHEKYREFSTEMYGVDRFTVGLTVEHRPTAWLTQRLTTGMDLTSDSKTYLQPRLSPDLEQFFGSWGYYSQVGQKSVNYTDARYTTVDYSATASLELRQDLKSTTSFGAQYYRKEFDQTWRQGRVFPAREITAIAAAGETYSWDDFIQNTTFGIFIEQRFGWSDRLFVSGALRADDNSAFGNNFDAVIYPKFSAAWVVSEEPFWNVEWIDALRLRGAWGASGQQPDAYSAARTYQAVIGRDGQSVLRPSAIGNMDLKPERGEELEVGFDASFFESRLGLEMSAYNKLTNDALLLRNVPPSSGYSTGDGLEGEQWINGGKIRNRGLELMVTGRLIETEALRWEMTFGGALNENEVLELAEGIDYLTVDYLQNRHQPGYPVGSFFRKHIVEAELGDDGRIIPGSIRCDDGNGGAVACADAPQVFRGRPDPKYEGAVTNTITLFDRVTVSALVDFKAGHHLWNVNRWVACGAFYQTCQENHQPELFDPTWIAELQIDPTLYAWKTIENASYAKLREVSVSYRVPSRWAGTFGASSAMVTIAGRNLHTWTRYGGFDPEGAVLSHRNLPEEDQTVPPMRSVQMTVRLSF